MCSTFHSFAYGLIRRYSPPELYAGPLRLLSAPEQDVVLRELLVETPESVALAAGAAPGRPAPAASPTRSRAVLGRAREKGLDGEELGRPGPRHDAARARGGRAASSSSTSRSSTTSAPPTTPT